MCKDKLKYRFRVCEAQECTQYNIPYEVSLINILVQRLSDYGGVQKYPPILGRVHNQIVKYIIFWQARI